MKKLFFHISIITLLFLAQSCHNKIEKELTFLTFNVWQEGTSVPNGLKKIHDIIIAVNPDVVCFVEVRNYKDQDWTSKIIEALDESGPKASYVHNLLETSNTEHEKFVADQLPWPSDHKAILAQLNFTFIK